MQFLSSLCCLCFTAGEIRPVALPDKSGEACPPVEQRGAELDLGEPGDLRRVLPPKLQSSVARLLPPTHTRRKCLVLDLDETLVHSSFQSVKNADFVIPIEMGDRVHNVHVLKRPGVDDFLRRMGAVYEVVIFTASLAQYADAVIDRLDTHSIVTHRLFRESCVLIGNMYVKNLDYLGRDMRSVAIVDNSSASYLLHSSHAIPISTWLDNPLDRELTHLADFLELMAACDDVVPFIARHVPK